MSSNNSKQQKKHDKRQEKKKSEDTTFIVMVLRPVDPKLDTTVDPNLLAVLTGWCVIAAHGLDAAMRHVAKIDLGIDLRAAAWEDVGSGGKRAKLADGWMIQVLPAPLYIVEAGEPLIAPPPYIM